jgi:hypothetical protein
VKKGAVLVLLGTILGLLVLTSFLITTGRGQSRGPWRFFPKDTAHWYGWAGAILLAVSATYSALKRGFPQSIRLWLFVHCIPGILSLVVTAIHLLNRLGRARLGHFLSFFTFGLMAVIVVGGVVGRYRVKIPLLREYWRQLHLPLTALFYITLTLHLLQKTGLV